LGFLCAQINLLVVRPKKNLGQHFLKDENIARNIVDLFSGHRNPELLLEIGPGTGVLTRHLIEPATWKFRAADVDQESIDWLKTHYPLHQEKFLLQDFLQWHPEKEGIQKLGIIGNFPYNISSQIFFHLLDMKAEVTEVVCMLQREVARRIASEPGSKEYGILSVLLQSRYAIQYAFTVSEHVFDPPPKVKSGVIRLALLEDKIMVCSFGNLKKVVKQAFNTRRKTLRNALKPLGIPPSLQEHAWLDLRAEQLSVIDFEQLTAAYEEAGILRKSVS
jgi:16S rRNA (adenine1518-N6/adenine1519-N6)-dimethyltransferase